MAKEICFENYRYRHHVTESPQKADFVRHAHRAYEIQYFCGGNASYVVENRRYRLSPGDVVLIGSSQYHFVSIEGDAPYDRAFINFCDDLCDHPLLSRVFSGSTVYHTASLPEFAEYYRRLDRYADLPDPQDRKIVATALLSELLCLIAGLDGTYAAPASENGNPTVDAALCYIDAHLTEMDGTGDLCRALFVSKSYLYRAFSAALSISPMQYVRRKRLLYAHNLLRSGEKPIKVYTLCGFQDYSAFYRAYRAYFGTSPTEEKGNFST